MKSEPTILARNPPRLISTLLRGFNTVAGQIHLIIIPVLVDLILWLGPKLRVKDLLLPVVKDFSANLIRLSPPELVETVTTSNTVWEKLLDQFNLFTVIRTFPVGIPSLIARESVISSPLGTELVWESPSIRIAIGVVGVLLVVGFFLGTVYFNALSRFSLSEPEKLDWKQLFFQYSQSLLQFLLIVVMAFLVSVPTFLMLSVFSLISPGLAQFFILMILFIVLWIIMPLIFSPHGVFVLNQKAFPSMLLSVRLVRFFLPGTGLFILSCLLISEGLNILWALPDPETWLTLVGIGGHAFIVTALLTASFVYYRDGLRWMQFNIQKMNEAKMKQESGGNPVDQQ